MGYALEHFSTLGGATGMRVSGTRGKVPDTIARPRTKRSRGGHTVTRTSDEQTEGSAARQTRYVKLPPPFPIASV